MTARTKIEELTYSWYGFDVVAALASVLVSGFGLFRLFASAFGLAISLMITWAIGKALLGKSHVTRFLLLLASVLSIAFNTLHGAWLVFWSSWTFTGAIKLAMTAATIVMAFRSIRTLRDSSVKAYFG
jgi:hypothetical protein